MDWQAATRDLPTISLPEDDPDPNAATSLHRARIFTANTTAPTASTAEPANRQRSTPCRPQGHIIATTSSAVDSSPQEQQPASTGDWEWIYIANADSAPARSSMDTETTG